MSLEEQAFKECFEPDRDYSKSGSKFRVTLSRPAEALLAIVSVALLAGLLVFSALAVYPPLGLAGAFAVAVVVAALVGVAGRLGPRWLARRRAPPRQVVAVPDNAEPEVPGPPAPDWKAREETRSSHRPPRQERLDAPDPREGPPLSEAELGAALLAGALRFDRGEFWEAHEAWEAAWHRAPPRERDFFQGLIHVAAALHHHRKANVEGHELQRGKAFKALRKFGPRYRGVSVEEILTDVVNLPPPGTATRYPRIGLEGA